jgi:peptide deformylase
MSKLEIKKYGDPVLRKKTIAVLKINADIKKLVSDMLETMYLVKGVGIAAPQVGISLRLCVVDVDPNKKSPVIMINPEIISGENKVSVGEGCLSFPGVYENVKRFGNVVAQYTDLDGKKCEVKSQDLFAKAMQHEIDHLDGKLFIDYLADGKRKSIEKEIKRKRKIGDW